MVGEAVTVWRKVENGTDDLGADVWEWEAEDVGDVLVAPGSLSDSLASNRPDGAVVAYTLHFPKSYSGDLAGCDVEVRGRRCHVKGHPDGYTPGNTPGRWNMPVEVSYVEN